MINYEWITDPCDCLVSQGTMEKVVKTVHWRLIGTDENNVLSDIYGAENFPDPSEESFIPFEELTKEIIVEWLSSVLDVPTLKKQIEDAIYLINNPVMVQLSLPRQE
jgi:hypothetical protein